MYKNLQPTYNLMYSTRRTTFDFRVTLKLQQTKFNTKAKWRLSIIIKENALLLRLIIRTTQKERKMISKKVRKKLSLYSL